MRFIPHFTCKTVFDNLFKVEINITNFLKDSLVVSRYSRIIIMHDDDEKYVMD
jgi:hypothetical protein